MYFSIELLFTYMLYCYVNFSVYETLNNYMVFNDVDGIYTYTFEVEKKVSVSFQNSIF